MARLTDETIKSGNATWNRRWLRICEVSFDDKDRVAELRRRVTALRDVARSGQRVPLPSKPDPLPWRLTDFGIATVNRRLLNVCYPHYTPVCHIPGESFIKRSGIWRTANKLVAFLVLLIPSLRGFVPKLRDGLRSLIWGLRILEGQTYSVNEAGELHLEPGFKGLKKSDIERARKLIIEGLSLVEGCCPVRCLVPAIHCLVHYADGADLHGLLKLLWMISFGLVMRGRCLVAWLSCHFLLNLSLTLL